MLRLHLPGLLLLVHLALVPPPPAFAQARDGSPSARELREAYPLHATPEPRVGEAPTPAPAAPTPSDRPAEPGSSQATVRFALAAVLVIAAFAAGFGLALRPPRGRSPDRSPSPTDVVALAPANGSGAPQTIAAMDRSDPSQAPVTEPVVASPPATSRGWTAEIEWCEAGAEAYFRVVARATQGTATAVVAESARLGWPPADAAAAPTMTAAAEELETRLVAAGWRPLPSGAAWYAKRFAWEPVVSMPAAPGRFERRAAWPENTEQTSRAK